ncbi:hypothetical protein SCUCBS95973_001028 [Sporothrix curviconia]|uniref:Uncharacterized protein n=1 Tax=Sporothrix curviconia TaxID=1260050 RepID=A0ABP0AV40_9PEZI
MTSPMTGTIISITGTPTVFVPLSTAWPSATGCISNIYLHTPIANPGTFIAWDPLYGAAMVTSAQSCLPEQVTLWWNQPSASLFTALGPAFQCPGAYSPVQTAVVASSLHQTFCCPTGYNLLAPQANTAAQFPSQCVSTITSGQKFAYLASQGQSGQSTTTVVMTASATVFAIPVNGFDFAVGPTLALDTLSTQTSTLTSKAALPASSTSSTSSTSAQLTSTSASTTPDAAKSTVLTPGASAGIAVGIIAAVAFLAVVEKHRSLTASARASPVAVVAALKSPKELYSDSKFDSMRGYSSEVYELPER